MIELRIAAESPQVVVAELRAIAVRFPGRHDLRLVVGAPRRALVLGPAWRCDGSAACLAALAEHGDVAVLADLPRQGRAQRPLLARVWGRARGAS